jgi:hypothetical protein
MSNSTNSNKTNNNYPSQEITQNCTQKRPSHDYVDGNPGPGLGQAIHVAGLEWLMGSQPFPLYNWISNSNIDISKQF